MIILGFILVLLAGIAIGLDLERRRGAKENEWRLNITMDIVTGSSYPITLTVTRKGKAAQVPAGATVTWAVSDESLGAVTVSPDDQTKATLVAGAEGGTGTVTAKVNFTGRDGEPKELDATSDVLTVGAGDPDGAAIEVGAELP